MGGPTDATGEDSDVTGEGSDVTGEGPDPHDGQRVVTAGAPIGGADVAVVLLHGRGATADGVVNLAQSFYRHGVAFFAPQAARSRWYPYAAAGPVDRNEPHLSSAVRAVERVFDEVEAAGIPPERTVLFGFSQGASVAAEVLLRNPRRLGAVVVLSGGLVGPEKESRVDEAAAVEGSLDGTPVFVGSGDADESVPVDRVRETAAVLRELDGDVTLRIYEGLEHGISEEEFAAVRSLVESVQERSAR